MTMIPYRGDSSWMLLYPATLDLLRVCIGLGQVMHARTTHSVMGDVEKSTAPISWHSAVLGDFRILG
jgi:hypothetical protein